MSTNDRQPEVAAFLAQRAARGADRYDEVWNGELHVAPAPRASHGDVDRQLARLLYEATRAAGLHDTGPFNLGTPDDYRVPDAGWHRERPTAVFVPTALLVAEIVSPGDETYEKFGFYAAHDVQEVLVVDPEARSVQWFRREGRSFAPVAASAILSTGDLAALIDWPPAG